MNDFKKYYCKNKQSNIWVLGYFGGSVNFCEYEKMARTFVKETGVAIESIYMDEIYHSSRYKGFKFIFSSEPNQTPCKDSKQLKDVFEYLRP